MDRIGRIAIIICGSCSLIMILLALFLIIPFKTNVQTFEIKKREDLSTIVAHLEEQDIVFSGTLFKFYALLSGNSRRFRAGAYDLSPRMSTFKLVQLFALGKSRATDASVTIFEGTNLADIELMLVSRGIVKPHSILNANNLKAEGTFFPDTYRFAQGISGQEALDIMQANFRAKSDKLLSGLDEAEARRILIVASMLEKEVRSARDMRLVAGIIENRLKKDMPLQLDASVAYGACHKLFLQNSYCDVSQVNLVDNIRKDSEYNTYMRKGLPAGPITNPGLQAISAALHPEPSSYYYYLSDRNGVTHFSRTGAEHVAARNKYL